MTESLGHRIAEATSTVNEARSVLELVADHSDGTRPLAGALYGALTIMGVALEQLGKLEVEAHALRQGGEP